VLAARAPEVLAAQARRLPWSVIATAFAWRALELMEETLDRDEFVRAERIAAQAEDPAAVMAAAAPKRKFSPGYYLWVQYLLGLEVEMDAGVAVAAALAGADVAGLLAVREARLEFERLHPRCGCGRLLKHAFDKKCPECQGGS
jgi:hypothetical protein